jgi:cysteine desulfurase
MIYLDNNATTPPGATVVERMLPFFKDGFANPSSPYAAGRRVASALWEARSQAAALVHAEPEQIVFTSGGTEANNTAFQFALASPTARRKIVVSSVEHASVVAAARRWEAHGYSLQWVPVDRRGGLDLAALHAAVDGETALVSVMLANNETGILFPIEEVARCARAAGAQIHVDAVQALGKVLVDAPGMGVDFLAGSAHKFHGPKGIGLLWIRELNPAPGLILGGEQERGRRGGTENVAGIVGLGEAAAHALEGPSQMAARTAPLRDAMEKQLLERLSGGEVLGRDQPRLPNTSCLLLKGADAEGLIALLDMDGICCSSGSACASGSAQPSHVLHAMGLRGAALHQVLRISLSRDTSHAEMDAFLDRLPVHVDALRKIGAVH